MTRAAGLLSFAGMSYALEQATQQQVLALGRRGWPIMRIAVATQVDRATVTRYLRAAGVPVRRRGRPSDRRQMPQISDNDPPANPAISPGEVSTDPAPSRAPRSSACEPHRERIEAAVRLGRNAMAIWQDLVDEVGFSARYASVRRFVRQLRRTAPPEAPSSSSRRPARKRRWTTAGGRWSAIRTRASNGGRAFLS